MEKPDATRADACVLSLSQMNIWHQEQAFSGMAMNNICCVLNVEGTPNLDILKNALENALAATPVLRTKIMLEGDTPRQYLSDEPLPPVEVYDFTHAAQGVESWADAVAATPFDVQAGWLFTAAVFRRSVRACGVLLCVHHLLSDAWTQRLILSRVHQEYVALSKGETLALPAFPDYLAHIDDEQAYLSSPRYQKDAAFWREYMKDAQPLGREMASLPVAQRMSVPLPRLLSRMLEVYLKRERVSPFLLFLAALMVYKRRVTGQDKPCVGVPVLGRHTALDKRTPGMFVQTLPILIDVQPEETFNAFVKRLNECWYEVLRHERFPYREIEKMAGGGGLFDVALSFQAGITTAGLGERHTFNGQWHFSGYQGQKMCLHIASDGEALHLDVDYRTQAYTKAEARAQVEGVLHILSESLERPDAPLASISLMCDAQRESVLQKAVSHEKHAHVLDTPKVALQNVWERYKTRAALIYDNQRVTYAALYEAAKEMATALDALKLNKNEAVSIEYGRTPALFIGICAALMAGVPFVLPDLSQPKARVERIRARACVAAVMDEQGIRTVARAADVMPLKGDCAYLVATSGSSGEPKLVAVPQKAMMNFVAQIAPFYGRSAVLSICNSAFDAFLIESVGALLNARTVVIAPYDALNDPDALATLMRAYDAGVLALTPSRMTAYLTSEHFCEALFHAESIILGGEECPADLCARLSELTSARIYNQYGPSEAAVCVSAARIDTAAEITCGKPLGGCRIYVLDEALAPVPLNAQGEICIAGDCLALGYQGDDKATARSFVSTPFEERLYRTGDVGRITFSGELKCMGRKDGQVKRNGRRIELGEIAACLRTMAGVLNAHVLSTAQGFVAYVAASGRVDENSARAYLLERLPAYMVPGAYVFIDALPMTNNGKVDERALPVYQKAQRASDALNDVERTVLNIFKDTLGNNALGAEDEYFMAGGDSLSALRTLSVLKEHFSYPFTVKTLATHGSARALAACLMGAHAVRSSARSIEIAPKMDAYPLSPQQKHFYALMMMDKGTTYNMPGAYLMPPEVDRARLEDAFRRLIALEEQFRVRFVLKDAEVVAEYVQEVPFALETLEGDDLESAYKSFVRPFDVAVAPLLRVGVYQGAQGDVLLMDMPHIISDGQSGVLMAQRLKALYEGQTPSMPPISYRDYACACAGCEQSKEDKAFWEDALKDFPPPLEIPVDYAGQGAPCGAQYRFTMDSVQSEQVEKIARHQRVTPFAVLCGLYLSMLELLCGQDDICVGTPISMRDSETLEMLCGVMINTLPLRVKLSGSYAQRFDAVFNALCGVMAHRDVEPSRLFMGTGRRGDAPLYETMFSLLPASPETLSMGDAVLRRINVSPLPAKALLSLEAVRETEGYAFLFSYDAAHFEEKTVAYFARCFGALFKHALAEPEAQPTVLGALDMADRVRLFNRPLRRKTPIDMTTLLERVQENAMLMPGATAVVSTKGSLTYAQMVKKAHALAAYLHLNGVARGEHVGVLLKRDLDMLPVLMGIWAAGCAYVPLDKALPRDRLSEMLEIADVHTVLCSEETEPRLDTAMLKVSFDAPVSEPLPIPDVTDIAYVLFTSGSTGKPKGVKVPHGALCNLALEAEALLEACHTVLCATSVMFDVFVTETWLPLILGRSIALADEQQMMLPSMMATFMQGTHVDVLQLTPSRMQLCLSDANFISALKSLKRVLLIGEELTLTLKNAIAARTDAAIINQYGPTEATVLCSYQDVTKSERTILIGKPNANCRFYALNERQESVLPMAKGELYIAGECLATGYQGDEKRTLEAFLDDPFVKGARMYRTGDIVRMTVEGEWQFLGRRDAQIKLDGHRIEPGEIASAALKTQGVLEAVAVPHYEQGAVKCLRLFLVVDASYDRQATIEGIKACLPAYMLPARIEELSSMPRLVSGKTDLKALAKRPFLKPEHTGAPQAPIVHDFVRDIWCEALKNDHIGDEDNFFSLGGTSLSALMVINRYFERGSRMTIEQFYQSPTLNAQRALLGVAVAPLKNNAPILMCPDMPLSRSTPRSKGTTAKKGDVLLTGASGYLGAHVLKELLMRGYYVVCLTRNKEHLRDVVNTYFGDRVFGYKAVEGDLLKPRFGLPFRQYADLAMRTGLVVHAAADVRHFANDDTIERTNVDGTRRVIDFCIDAEAALCHVSTTSVAGRHANTAARYSEQDFYIGQDGTQNAYIRSKLRAEEMVYDAMKNNNLTAQVMRVGRLVSRFSDGKFQVNARSNAFYRMYNGLLRLGAVPEGMADMPLDLTPVDACAQALVGLLGEDEAVFHLCAPMRYTMRDVAKRMRLDIVSDDRFAALLRAAIAADQSPYFASVASFLSGGEASGNITLSFEHTLEVLNRVRFEWPNAPLEMLLMGIKEE